MPGMGEGFDIPLADIGRYLEAEVAGFRGLQSAEKFTAGQSNPTWALTADSGRYVLRTKPPGILLASAHQVDREYRVMAALAGSGVPVPQVLHLSAGGPLGRAFYVMEHLDGRIVFDPALPEMPAAARAAHYDAMNTVLARLHALDPLALGLGDFGRPGNYFARQTDRWARQYRASAPQPDPGLLAVADWLAANLPHDDGQVALVHGDYRLDNLIFAPDGPQVIGVLDWELSTLGHPMADLAYQCMQWRLPHDAGMRGLGGLDRAALGLPTEADYVAAYAVRRGMGEVPHWRFGLVFAYFRLAAILQGVVARADAGNASNPATARRYARAIPVLAAQALDLLEDRAA